MSEQQEWDKRYTEKDLPWDIGYPDGRLMDLVAGWGLNKSGGKVLEVGCGTGSNALWLAEQGFQVTAVDISPAAVALAEERAKEQGLECIFQAEDFLKGCSLEPKAFNFLFDRGCFHSVGQAEERRTFARQAASLLASNGIWFSLIGNKDQATQKKGPPRMSVAEISAAVEEDFEILRLESSWTNPVSKLGPLRFWQCLMRLRG